ncbi:MAG: AbrB/MazE/SpoVT family DNA-binding domain-containing protein [Nanoarchaeota archaeon]
MMQLTIGQRGEIVIPKKVRLALGFLPSQRVVLEVEKKTLKIIPAKEDIIDRMEQRAIKNKADVSKWVMGDELYEEVF